MNRNAAPHRRSAPQRSWRSSRAGRSSKDIRRWQIRVLPRSRPTGTLRSGGSNRARAHQRPRVEPGGRRGLPQGSHAGHASTADSISVENGAGRGARPERFHRGRALWLAGPSKTPARGGQRFQSAQGRLPRPRQVDHEGVGQLHQADRAARSRAPATTTKADGGARPSTPGHRAAAAVQAGVSRETAPQNGNGPGADRSRPLNLPSGLAPSGRQPQHPDDPLQVVDRGELDGDPALAPAEVDLDPGLEPVREPVGQVASAPGACGLARASAAGFFAGRRRPARARRSPRSRAPRAPRRRSGRRAAPAAPASSSAEQRPGVPGGEHAGGDPALHRRGQLQQPDRVGDLRPAAADPAGQLLVGAPKSSSSCW